MAVATAEARATRDRSRMKMQKRAADILALRGIRRRVWPDAEPETTPRLRLINLYPNRRSKIVGSKSQAQRFCL
jgi:hypothetical protein